jgi:hypothetical protein
LLDLDGKFCKSSLGLDRGLNAFLGLSEKPKRQVGIFVPVRGMQKVGLGMMC